MEVVMKGPDLLQGVRMAKRLTHHINASVCLNELYGRKHADHDSSLGAL